MRTVPHTHDITGFGNLNSGELLQHGSCKEESLDGTYKHYTG